MKQHTPTNAAVNPLTALIDLIADAVVAKLKGPVGTDWIDQSASPLGRIRHCSAVRRRVAKALPGACIVGREFRLSPEALQEELAAVSKKRVPAKPEKSSVTDELTRELRMVGGGR